MSETVADEQNAVVFPECRNAELSVAQDAFLLACTRVGYAPGGQRPDFAEIRERARRIMTLAERFPQFGMDAVRDLVSDPARTVDQSIDCAEQLAAFVCAEVSTVPVPLRDGGAFFRALGGGGKATGAIFLGVDPCRDEVPSMLSRLIEAEMAGSIKYPLPAGRARMEARLHAGFNDPEANPAAPEQL